jgi:hypothetical protein
LDREIKDIFSKYVLCYTAKVYYEETCSLFAKLHYASMAVKKRYDIYRAKTNGYRKLGREKKNLVWSSWLKN